MVDGPLVEVAVLSIFGLDARPTEASYTPRTQFVFPLQGVHLLADGRQDILVDLNHAAIIPHDSVTQDRHPRAGDMSCLIVTPDPAHAEGLWLGDPRAGTAGCSARPLTPRAQMSARLMTSAGREADREELALELVSGLQPERAFRPPIVGGKPLRLVRTVKELLSESFQPISLPSAAAEVGVSATYLTTLFNQLEGMPLYRYHLRIRLAEALRHLPRTEDITALALDLGFSSHSHFSSAFRAHFGVSPSHYRGLARARSVGWTASLEPAPPRLHA